MSKPIFELLQHIIDCCRSYLDEHQEHPSLFDDIAEVSVDSITDVDTVSEDPLPKRAPKSYNAKKLGLIAVDRLVEKIHLATGAGRDGVRIAVRRNIASLGLDVKPIGTHKYITIAAAELIERSFN